MKHILVLNRWQTPDGTVLISKHRHDYVAYTDKNGEEYFVDGGHDYVRMSTNNVPMKDMCVYADDKFETVRQYEYRGALVYKDGDTFPKTVWVPLRAMSDQHVCNCITYNLRRVDEITRYEIHTHLYVKELLYRIAHDLFLDEYEYNDTSVNEEPKYEYVTMDYYKADAPEPSSMTLKEIKDTLDYAGANKDAVHSFDTYLALTALDKMYFNLEQD